MVTLYQGLYLKKADKVHVKCLKPELFQMGNSVVVKKKVSSYLKVYFLFNLNGEDISQQSIFFYFHIYDQFRTTN